MKKSLLAVAAIGAFASAAQAQSSVTVYGLLDVGYAGSTSKTTTVTNGQQIKSNQTGFTGLGSESTSRLGFKGVEDLGGGMNAFFTLEYAVSPTEATQISATSNRQAFAGLAKTGLGNVAIGTQYTPIHLAVGATDPGQQNNMKGNVIYQTSANQGAGETTSSYTVRYFNAITLASESFAGFKGYAMFGQKNADNTQLAPAYTTTSGGGNNNSSTWGLGVNYTWNKLYATIAYQSGKTFNDATNATTSTNIVNSTAGYTTSYAANANDNQSYAAATYDFGILKGYVQWVGRKVTSTVDTGYYAKRTAQQIGVRSFITPKIEAWGSIGNGRVQSFGNGEPTANFNGWQLGSNYLLSKRTNLYAIYGQHQTSSVTNGANAGGTSYGVGVRHTF